MKHVALCSASFNGDNNNNKIRRNNDNNDDNNNNNSNGQPIGFTLRSWSCLALFISPSDGDVDDVADDNDDANRFDGDGDGYDDADDNER